MAQDMISLVTSETKHNLISLGWGDWLEQTTHQLPDLLRKHGLNTMGPLWGSNWGICLLADSQEGKVVVKSMPEPHLNYQALALEGMSGNGAPKLLDHFEQDGLVVMQYLSGDEQTSDYSPMELVELLVSWERIAPQGLPSTSEWFHYWRGLLATAYIPEIIEQAVLKAEEILAQIPEDSRLLHGDLGWYNLFRQEDGRLVALGPEGHRGNLEWDLACALIAYAPGVRAEQVKEMVGRTCALLGTNPEWVAQYAAVRSVLSALRAWRRNNQPKLALALQNFNYWLED